MKWKLDVASAVTIMIGHIYIHRNLAVSHDLVVVSNADSDKRKRSLVLICKRRLSTCSNICTILSPFNIKYQIGSERLLHANKQYLADFDSIGHLVIDKLCWQEWQETNLNHLPKKGPHLLFFQKLPILKTRCAWLKQGSRINWMNWNATFISTICVIPYQRETILTLGLIKWSKGYEFYNDIMWFFQIEGYRWWLITLLEIKFHHCTAKYSTNVLSLYKEEIFIMFYNVGGN